MSKKKENKIRIEKFITYSGIFSLLITVIGISLSAFLTRGFNWHQSYLSDLGADNTLSSAIYNGALILCGIFNLLFVINFLSVLKIRGKFLIGFLFIFATLSVSLQGIISRTVESSLHGYIAKIYIITAMLGILVLGLIVFHKKKVFGGLSILISVLSVIIPLLTMPLFHGKAISEILYTFFICLWLLIASIYYILYQPQKSDIKKKMS